MNKKNATDAKKNRQAINSYLTVKFKLIDETIILRFSS